MKTAVSVPDDLFRRADALADRLGKTRSAVYRDALVEYLARREEHAVTDAYDRLADDLAAEGDGFAADAARRTLERSEW